MGVERIRKAILTFPAEVEGEDLKLLVMCVVMESGCLTSLADRVVTIKDPYGRGELDKFLKESELVVELVGGGVTIEKFENL